ncbi:MAG TPA: condensation domain-containing protein, partial [Pyrinomonadaceae bacterium]
FRRMVRGVREAALGAYEHQEAPFEKVVEAAGPERRANLSPLFQLKLNVQNVEVGSLSLEGLKLTPMTAGNDGIDVDLMVVLADSAEGFRGWIHYRTDLYEVPAIARVAAHFEAVLRHVTARPEITLGEMKRVLAEMEEQERVLKGRQREEKRLSKLKNVKPVAVSLPVTEG